MRLTEKKLGCDYEGYEFGGGYIDSCCIDGFLWDLDSCDEPGGGLTNGGEWACPRCNTEELLSHALEEAKGGGCGQFQFTPYCAAVVWEGAIRKAASEQRKATATFLAGVEPFQTDDWPDRQAVYDGRASWRDTVSRSWPWELPDAIRLALQKEEIGQ